MKRTFKKIISLLAVSAIMLSAFAFNTAAASGRTIFSVSNKSPKVGDTVTVTVTISADEDMYATEANVSVDAGILQFVSGSSANLSGGSIKIVGTPGGSKSQSYTLTFTAKAAGKTAISISGVKYVGADEVSVTGASDYITVTEPTSSATPSTPSTPTPSSNANLSSITVSSGKLSPSFSASRTSYSVEVENSVNKITLGATAADSGAKITGTVRNRSIKVGLNSFVISVTAADGTKKNYTVNVTRLAKDGETTPSDDEPTVDTPIVDPENPYLVKTETGEMLLQQAMGSISAPLGFTETETAFGGTVVKAFVSGDAKTLLYALADTEGKDAALYTYNSDKEQFEQFKYYQNGERLYIFVEADKKATAPKGFYKKMLEIGGIEVDAFGYEDSLLSDFAVVYCEVNGEGGYYRYDAKEGTMQRLPEFKPLKDSGSENSLSTNADKEGGFIKWFTEIPSNGRIILIAAVIVLGCIIALVAFLVIRIVKNRKPHDDENGLFIAEDGYDYSVEDAQPFVTVEETEE